MVSTTCIFSISQARFSDKLQQCKGLDKLEIHLEAASEISVCSLHTSGGNASFFAAVEGRTKSEHTCPSTEVSAAPQAFQIIHSWYEKCFDAWVKLCGSYVSDLRGMQKATVFGWKVKKNLQVYVPGVSLNPVAGNIFIRYQHQKFVIPKSEVFHSELESK